MSELRDWVNEMRTGRLSLGDLVVRINARGRIGDADHIKEMEDLEALLRDSTLDPKLYRAVKSKLAELQGVTTTQTRTGRPKPPPLTPASAQDERTVFLGGRDPAKPEDGDDPFGATVAIDLGASDVPPEFLATVAMSEPIVPKAPGDRTKPPAPPAFDATVALQAGSHGEDATRVRAPAPGATVTGNTGRSQTGSSTGTGNSASGISARSWERLSQISAPAQEVGPGTRLKDRFVLEQEIGRGGMGVVYLATDERKVEARDRNPRVAVKVLNDEFRRHPDSLIALQRESRKAQQLAHDNIVRVYDFDKDGAVVFMTMEYVDGSDLKALIKSLDGRGLPVAEAMPLIEGMCLALGRAHREGIVHSDFKPGNVMLTSTRIPKVFDFGIARAGKSQAQTSGEQTVFDAGTLGALTPAYASLEMLHGTDPEPADDIYALACVVYEILAGRHPYDKTNAEQAQKRGMVPLRIPGLTNKQWRTLAKGLAFERKDRIQSADALLQGLRPQTLQQRVLPFALAGGGGLVALILVIWLVTSMIYRGKVSDVEECIAGPDCADAAVLAERLQSLEADDRNRIRESKLDAIKAIFYRSLSRHWAPEEGRHHYATARPVVDLAFQLYGADSAWVKEFSDNLEAGKNKELSRLNDEFNRQMEAGVFTSPADDGRKLLAVLDAVRTIDATQPLLKDGRLAPAFATGIRAGLADPTLAPQAQVDLAAKRIDLVKAYVPDAAALKALQSDLAARRESIASADADARRAAQAAAEREQRMKTLGELIASPSDSPDWRTQVRSAWTAGTETGAEDQMAAMGTRLSGALLAQSAARQSAGDLDGALEAARFGMELMPGDARLDRQFKAVSTARDRQIAQAATEAERTRLNLQRFDELLARPVPAAGWIAEVDGRLRGLADKAAPQDVAARRDKLAQTLDKMVSDTLAIPDFAKAEQVAKAAAAIAPADGRFSGLPVKVADARRKAQAEQVAKFGALVQQKAFTPEWQKSIETALAALRGSTDPSVAAQTTALAQAYADRADQLTGQKSFAAARQVVEAGLRALPQSAPIKAAAVRINDAEDVAASEHNQQQAQFKVAELERTIALKAAASEISDALNALSQLRRLDPANAYAREQAPWQIADGSLKLAERFAAKKDYERAMRAADSGIAVLRTPELVAAKARYEQDGCTNDLERELKKRSTITDARRMTCLAVAKKKDP
ncbi:MAG TPA: protein kinase, partial [Nevskiaceae bacterium]|nr:protein kinase [Nevskiaceae bacterium]